ncbi:MAG: hypothetical protein ACXWJB_12385, partial [Limisphaerales bacterium]
MKRKTKLKICLLVNAVVLFLCATGFAQTINTWQEDWESPAAQDNWSNSGATWQIGVPTFGPAT